MIGWNSLDNTRNCKNEGSFSPAGLASHVQEGDDATVQDRGCAGHFSLLKKKKKYSKTWAKFSSKNRLDRGIS